MGTETFALQPRQPPEAVKKGQAGLRYNGLGPWFQHVSAKCPAENSQKPYHHVISSYLYSLSESISI